MMDVQNASKAYKTERKNTKPTISRLQRMRGNSSSVYNDEKGMATLVITDPMQMP